MLVKPNWPVNYYSVACRYIYSGLVAIVTYLYFDPLQGTIFDPETGDRLHIELAKSTSRRPRGGLFVYHYKFSQYYYGYLSALIVNYINMPVNQFWSVNVYFSLGGDVYRVIDKRANKTGGNAYHENIGDEGDEEAWGEDEDGDNDNSGQHYYLYIYESLVTC